uniref:N-acetyltransferase domain-containing protein n=1 Tax=Thermosporothrix sp. COM3 TaxID=2490863 RepID=A0A455SMY9_9CHLR|nr:hypothetical protein KTC_35190 [Thermosporothrix sp. COM3]
MTLSSPSKSSYEFGNGLVLRWSTAADAPRIANLVGKAFREKETDPLHQGLYDTVIRLMSGSHPAMGPNDYALVEDTSKEGKPVVACSCYLKETWSYDGIKIPVGRPEIVASDPEYRNQGLVRRVFELLHERSAANQDLLQAITGIPNFYRQFGYEYALDLGGKCLVSAHAVPELKEGESEPYSLREATEDDLPLIESCYSRRKPQSLVWCEVPAAFWRYHINAEKEQSGLRGYFRIRIIADAAGKGQGFLMVPGNRWGSELPVLLLDVQPGVPLSVLMPSLLRALKTWGEQLPSGIRQHPLKEITFHLGGQHPVYDALGKDLISKQEQPYAWYIRVPDLPAFLKKITPVLEQRLIGTAMENYSGELKLNFYRGCIRLVFKEGHLANIEKFRLKPFENETDGAFPYGAFLKLLFGYRGLDELRRMFPDVSANSKGEALLKILFPTRYSFPFGS